MVECIGKKKEGIYVLTTHSSNVEKVISINLNERSNPLFTPLLLKTENPWY